MKVADGEKERKIILIINDFLVLLTVFLVDELRGSAENHLKVEEKMFN